MDWKEEPATSQQLLRLQEYGFVPTCPLTVTQAARLIRQYSKRPAHSPAPQPAAVQATIATAPSQPYSAPSHHPPPAQVRGQPLSEAARLHAYQLRLLVNAAERTLAEHPDRPGVRADVNSAVAARQQFWLDTCREDRDRQSMTVYAAEFHQLHGVHYFPPTWGEVQEVLEALDAAMPGWDEDHPELFYETLKLNFPSLLRQK